MFDIGWSELLVIAVVLIVVVGPKDLPRMLRTFGKTTTQLRAMASDFRRQFDDALREAELDEVRDTVRDVRNLDPTKDIRAAMNPMRAIGDEIRSSLTTATRAPEPRVPAAGEPAKPADAPPPVAATGAPVASSDPGIMPAATTTDEAKIDPASIRKTEDAA